MEDTQIIRLFLQRNEDAIAETEQKYTKYCRKIAAHILQRQEDAEEALNDTWLAAWNSIPPHTPLCLQTFLGRLTRNISLNKVRAETAKKRGASEVRIVFEEIADWLHSEQDVENEIDERALADSINRFLDTVSETERNIFIRRYWYFQSISNIAAAHGFSESKVKSMLLRIRKKLYAKLKKEDFV